MPEVFNNNPHKGRMTKEDCDKIRQEFEKAGGFEGKISVNQFSKTDACYVGYGTAYRMINNPEYYENK